jgi:integrase
MATIEKYVNTAGTTLYAVRYRKPDKRQTTKRGFTTKRDAKAFAETVEVTKRRGEYVSHSDGRITIGELGPAWLDRQRGRLKVSTMYRQESLYWRHVSPRWKDVAIGAIRQTDVQAWVSELTTHVAEHGRGTRGGAATVGQAHNILANILDDAVTDGLLIRNPARGVMLARRNESRHTYLTATQLHRLADEAGEHRSLILLLGVGGLRWGEATALRVCDVDFLRRRVDVHRNVVWVKGQWHVGTPKSGKARMVSVPPSVIDALAATAKGKDREDLLWPGMSRKSGGQRPAIDYNRGAWFPHAVARVQATDPDFPRITPHDLRHTAASLAISSGANVKVVQAMLGHATAAMTLDTYAGLFDSDMTAVMDRLEDVLTRVHG